MKDIKQLIVDTKAIYNCLSHKKTITGIRRYAGEDDLTMDALLSQDPFNEDKKRIQFSKAFRRMAKKTQVTAFPKSSYIRSRMTHTLEVAACSIQCGDILGLHVPLIEAISYGHDMGHVPFGHQGEAFLAKHLGKKLTHEMLGVFVAQHVERSTHGLNLTKETLDGMYRHSGSNVSPTMTQEAWTAHYGDKIAYLFADYNDFERMQWPIPLSLQKLIHEFGSCHRERVTRTICELCIESSEKGKVDFSDSYFAKKFVDLRTEMYKIYSRIAEQDIERNFEFVLSYLEKLKLADPVLMISLMTDEDLSELSSSKMINFSHIKQTAVGEILDHLMNTEKELNYLSLDMDW